MAEDNEADLAHTASALAGYHVDNDWPYEFVSLILKAGLFDAREPTRAPTPDEAKGPEMIRGLVRIGREVFSEAVWRAA